MLRSEDPVLVRGQGRFTDDVSVESRLTNMSGFPAAEYKLRGSDGYECVVAVDVAANQQFLMVVRPLRKIAQSELCQAATGAAGMALQTLQSLKP